MVNNSKEKDMSNIANIALSGIRAARQAITTVSHNLANSSTPNYRKLDTVFTEMQYGGVSAKAVQSGDQFLVNELRYATVAKQNADIMANAYDQLSNAPTEDLQTSYSKLMEATHSMLRAPDNVISQEAFNQATTRFQNSMNRYQSSLTSLKVNLNAKIDLSTTRSAQLQEEIKKATTNGIADPKEINRLQNEYLKENANADTYRTVLSDVVAPIENAYKVATDTATSSINALSNTEVFKDGQAQRVTDFSTFDESKLPEWDSQWFNNETSRIQAVVGYKSNDADATAEYAATRLEDIQAQFGVDLVDEQIKLMRFQRMYEANAQVLRVEDQMVGTILNIMA